MIISALLDVDVSFDHLKAKLEKMNLSGWNIALGKRVNSDIVITAEEFSPMP